MAGDEERSADATVIPPDAASHSTQIIHLDVGRASARHVGLKPDLQPIDFLMPQELMNYLGSNAPRIVEREMVR